MNHGEFLKHVFEQASLHWPRKDLSGKPGQKGAMSQSKDWFGNSPRAHPVPRTIGRTPRKKKSH